jgi:hypothetical protein
LRDRGQFSIIAALLVAVVLIATVVITYSTIRNFAAGEHPQVLNAIDETNFALKQILGFTVGYYGSILQVTGNREYAYNLSYKYLVGGLDYIARMHPDWAASFNLKNVDLEAYWFMRQSYSKGKITVQYDLTGLGIYGINYATSCKLSVNVLGTDGDQARLQVTVDEKDEPLINLGKRNFKFYIYRYTNSTWAMTNPTTEPTAFSNGTYLIDIPQDVDPYSYVVQVEDPRGIITAASSFNQYICTLNWNPNAALIDKESFEGSWPPARWDATTNWVQTNEQKYDGAYSAKFEKSGTISSGNLTSYSLDCSDAVSIHIDFWYNSRISKNSKFSLQCFNGNTWVNVAELGSTSRWSNHQLRITDNQFFKSNFKVQWSAINLHGNDKVYLDFVTVKKEINLPVQNEPIVVELLQNGTIRWLGQNLTTQAKPIPPIPVKAIRVNQTINGVNCEVPFQIEDWASDYSIPLGLANNASVFNNRNMLVFLVNPNVSKVTIWWNGSDRAKQTPLAYTNKYFTTSSTTNSRTIKSNLLELSVDWSLRDLRAISKIGSVTSTAVLMRINDKVARWGDSAPAIPISNGPVRAVLHHEVEWGPGGSEQIPNCPNFYAHIVLTLPANATYYTYQLRLMFLNSAQSRTITDLCPIKLSFPGGQPKTENGTANGYPVVSNATGLFYNFSATCWQHHWSQLNSSLTKGAGIIFTDAANRMLYCFDAIAGSKTGALSVTSGAIELCPVTSARARASVSFTYSLDVIWYGAVVTFDETTPIYKPDGGGLWIIAEYPPTVTVTTES